MSTSAIITMVLVQGIITIITVRIFYLVLKPPKDNKGDKKS